MYKHIIPVNITDNGNFAGGFLKKRNTVEAAVIVAGVLLIFKVLLFAVPFFVKTVLFVVFAVLPAVVALIGIGDESLSEALATYIRYSRSKDILTYSLAELSEDIRIEKKGKRKRGS